MLATTPHMGGGRHRVRLQVLHPGRLVPALQGAPSCSAVPLPAAAAHLMPSEPREPSEPRVPSEPESYDERSSTGVSRSSTPTSSIVEGTGSGVPSAMLRMVLRRILPDRVFGSAPTTATSFTDATAPIWSRTNCTSSLLTSSGSRWAPALR